jgi:hypothetical protein
MAGTINNHDSRFCCVRISMRWDRIAYSLLRVAVVLGVLLMAFQPG